MTVLSARRGGGSGLPSSVVRTTARGADCGGGGPVGNDRADEVAAAAAGPRRGELGAGREDGGIGETPRADEERLTAATAPIESARAGGGRLVGGTDPPPPLTLRRALASLGCDRPSDAADGYEAKLGLTIIGAPPPSALTSGADPPSIPRGETAPPPISSGEVTSKLCCALLERIPKPSCIAAWCIGLCAPAAPTGASSASGACDSGCCCRSSSA